MSKEPKELTLDDILSADDVQIEPVSVPDWGGRLYVRSISGDKRDEIDQEFSAVNGSGPNLVGMRARVVGACLCDAHGKFRNPTDSQILALGKKSGAMLDLVFDVCQRLNWMRAEDVEELEKNSRMAAGTDSG